MHHINYRSNASSLHVKIWEKGGEANEADKLREMTEQELNNKLNELKMNF